MGIIQSIRDSAEGWRMGLRFASLKVFGGDSANLGGDSGIKEGSAKVGGDTGIPIYPNTNSVVCGWTQEGLCSSLMHVCPGPHIPILCEPPVEDPGTPATIVERIQQGIAKSLAGWRMGFAYVGGKTGEAFGNIGSGIGDAFKSVKWPLYALVAVFVFIAIMVSIGYSGVGAPAARVAEQEYGKRR